MGSVKKVVKKVANVATGGLLFNGGGGGEAAMADAVNKQQEQYKAQQEAIARQQRIERENQLILAGSTGTESAQMGGVVNPGTSASIGDTGFYRKPKKKGQNYSSSLGIM